MDVYCSDNEMDSVSIKYKEKQDKRMIGLARRQRETVDIVIVDRHRYSR